jgi:hypothetical protein
MWQVAVSSQAVAHMSLAQRLNFGGAFQNYEIMNDALKREQEAWLKLTLLDDSRILTEGDWTNLHSAYAEAKTLNARTELIADWILSHQSLGQIPAQSTDARNAISAAEQKIPHARPVT